MRSLAERVVAGALGVLLLSLTVVGLTTGVLLHVRTTRALDEVLLAAAFAEAHPWQDERYANQLVESPVDVRPWTPEDPFVPASRHAEALADERPTLYTDQGRRVLLLVVEVAGASSHDHLVVVAEADAVTPWDVLLPFAAIYGLVSIAVSALAGLALRVVLVRALEPLAIATEALASVHGLGSEARLERSEVAEVDALLGSTNALLDRLDQAFRAQSTFTAQAAHELRTPVTALKGELELALRRERSPEAYRQALEHAAADVERLAGLVEGLMLLARVDSGQTEQGRTVERLSAVVHEALRRERATLEAAGCTVSLELVSDPEVRLHVELMTIAVGNLLRNVARHAPGAPVQIRIGQGGAVVVVEDGGPGVPAEDRERLLERFARGSTRREGLGLGLPLAREIARRHGGELELLAGKVGLKSVLTVSSDSNVPLGLPEEGDP